MIRCAAYIRVSTEEQALHGYSLEAQKEALTEYANVHNMNIIDYYIDEGFSARKKMAKRKEFQRMLTDIKAGRIDLILFTKLDRWFRNISDYYKVQEILEQHKVNWKTIFENYDTSTANGRLHINIMLSVAQDEADRTSERIKVVFHNKKSRGEVTNGSHPLGFKIEAKRLVPDKEKMNLVRDIFDYYEFHQSVSATAEMVREKYNISFCNATISRILKNKIYTGEYGGIKNYTEPVIEINRFNRIQSIFPIPKAHKKNSRVYLFTGLLYCRECGGKLTANHSTVRYKDTVREYNVYRCKRYTEQKTCSHKKTLNEVKLENYLLNNVEHILKDYSLKAEVKELKPKNPSADKNKLHMKMDKLKELYLEGLIDKETFKYDYENLKEQVKSLQNIDTDRGLTGPDSLSDIKFTALYALFTDKEKRLFWRSLIRKIEVDCSNQFKIYYN